MTKAPAVEYHSAPTLFWFDLPQGFTELDLTESPEERAARIADAIDLVMPEENTEHKLEMTLAAETALHELIRTGAAHISHCLFQSSDGGLFSGILSVTLERGNIHSRREFVKETLRSWKESGDSTIVELSLPYGPAALQMAEVQIPPDNPFSNPAGDSMALPTTMRQQQTVIPLATCDRSASFSLIVEESATWEDCATLMAAVLKTVSSEPYAPSATTSERKSAAFEAMRSDFG